METLTSPKSAYLLEAGLDVLHFESREWLSELEFMKSELRFFMKLLSSKVFMLDKEPQRKHILENMSKLSTSVVHELEQAVKEHEKLLAELHKTGKGASDARYRSKHQELKGKMEQVGNDLRSLKMLVFNYIESVN